jgi:hypothetical protein
MIPSMLRYLRYLYIILICNLFLTACELFDKDSFTPAFIEVDKASLLTDLNQGDGVLRVEEIYLYKNEKLLGVFPIPGKIPIIVEGGTEDVELFITAAVRVDGQATTVQEYAFFDPIVKNIKLSEGQTVSVPLEFKYKNDTKFDFVDDFEIGNKFSTNIDTFSAFDLVETDIDKNTGSKSGLMTTSLKANTMEVTQFAFFDNKNNAQGRVFLEFDYKNEDNLSVGTLLLKSNTIMKEFKIQLQPSKTWNRVYIDLTNEISNQEVIGYKVVLHAQFNSGSGKMENQNFIDNVKLVHF